MRNLPLIILDIFVFLATLILLFRFGVTPLRVLAFILGFIAIHTPTLFFSRSDLYVSNHYTNGTVAFLLLLIVLFFSIKSGLLLFLLSVIILPAFIIMQNNSPLQKYKFAPGTVSWLFFLSSIFLLAAANMLNFDVARATFTGVLGSTVPSLILISTFYIFITCACWFFSYKVSPGFESHFYNAVCVLYTAISLLLCGPIAALVSPLRSQKKGVKSAALRISLYSGFTALIYSDHTPIVIALPIAISALYSLILHFQRRELYNANRITML